jgi:hypothetical protein
VGEILLQSADDQTSFTERERERERERETLRKATVKTQINERTERKKNMKT